MSYISATSYGELIRKETNHVDSDAEQTANNKR